MPVLELEDVLREDRKDTVHLCTPVEPFSIYPLSTGPPLSLSQLGPWEREATKSSQPTPFTLNTDIIEDGCVSGLHPISDLQNDSITSHCFYDTTPRCYERGRCRSRVVYKVRLVRFREADG